MTQRDLPKVGPATIVEPPVVSESLGSWTTGLSDHIDQAKFAALRELAGWTVEPTMTNPLDVLEVNGNRHLLDAIDDGHV